MQIFISCQDSQYIHAFALSSGRFIGALGNQSSIGGLVSSLQLILFTVTGSCFFTFVLGWAEFGFADPFGVLLDDD